MNSAPRPADGAVNRGWRRAVSAAQRPTAVMTSCDEWAASDAAAARGGVRSGTGSPSQQSIRAGGECESPFFSFSKVYRLNAYIQKTNPPCGRFENIKGRDTNMK